MSDPAEAVDESSLPVDSEMAAAAAAYMPGSPSDHHHDDSHQEHHHDDVDDNDDEQEEHHHHHADGGGEAEGGAHGDGDGDPDAAANSKWSRNGFGAAVPKQVGKFSKQESEGVRKAVEEYCAAKQISTARLCSECDHKAELKGSWMEIAKRLPHRSVQSVYRHGIRQLHPFKRGAWSEQETAVLTELVQRMGKKWSAIQTKLNRSADACRDKYREMSDDYVKGRWKDPEMELLKRLVREHLNVDAGTDMKSLGRMVEEQNIPIPWSTISKRIGKRSRLSCFKKWQKMAGLLSASDEVRRRKQSDIISTDEINGVGITAAVMAAGAAYSNKRLKTEGSGEHDNDEGDGEDEDLNGHSSTHAAPTAGAAAAMAAAAGAMAAGTGNGDDNAYDNDEVYNSAKMAEETVEAVDLPDVDGPTVHI